MSIFLEFIPNLFVALAFDFILYITGTAVLRVISFGLFKNQLHSYSEYKALKDKANNGYLMPYVIGIFFYAFIIVVIAWLN
jgi:hypothetical protein